MRFLKAPDFASRFNVMLYGEPICVLVLCTDQTSKVLQIQQVAAATREIAGSGADGGTRTPTPLRRADFRTTSTFAAAVLAFVVWTIPSP